MPTPADKSRHMAAARTRCIESASWPLDSRMGPNTCSNAWHSGASPSGPMPGMGPQIQGLVAAGVCGCHSPPSLAIAWGIASQ